ncbi:MAG: glycosyltransferase, partial [Formivibrio sp.]|nr:glycosyltransferase [Formivibrio sp.]
LRHYPHLMAPKLAKRLEILIDVNNERLERRREWMPVPDRAVALLNVPLKSYVSETQIHPGESYRGPLRFLYQGTLGSSNGLSFLFDSFRLVDPLQYTLALAGYTDDPQALIRKIGGYFPAGNVSYSGLLPRTELPEFMSRHDVGIALYPWRNDPMNPGFELCAPNKLYEYLARGLPVVCSDNASLQFVKERKLGWQIDPESPHQLSNLIGTLCRQRDTVSEYGKNALALSQQQWNFEHQFTAIVDLIRQI